MAEPTPPTFGRRERAASQPAPSVDKTLIVKATGVAVIAAALVTGYLVFAPSSETRKEISTSDASGKMWVTTDRLQRRTCPSTDCGVVGELYFGEGVPVLETKDGWSKTNTGTAICTSGQMDFIKSGNKACTAENGIVGGKYSEWVQSEYLSAERPADPAEGATGIAKLVGDSTDYQLYKKEFIAAAQQLLDEGKCSERDFREWGGWTQSTSNGSFYYFVPCGNSVRPNKYLLNVQTGKLSMQ